MMRVSEDKIKNIVDVCLRNLSAAQLKAAFLEANKKYVDDVGGLNQNGNFRGGGALSLFKQIKSFIRTPSDDDITDENVHETLKTFLANFGGNDIASLKYQVLSQLTAVQALNDDAAKNLVTIFKNKLTHLTENRFPGTYFTLGLVRD